MNRIDLTKLRKRAGMSQRDLAERLQVQPSFLSAIENGRSRLPEEKEEKIKEIFELDSLDDYMIDDFTEQPVPPHTHSSEPSDSIAKLLNHFHDLAHQHGTSGNSSHEAELQERIDYLSKRNDKLSERLDDMREEVDQLRKENLMLKELLLASQGNLHDIYDLLHNRPDKE